MNSRKVIAASKAYAKICRYLGIPLTGDSKDTPMRVVKALEEMTEGLRHGSILAPRYTTFAANGCQDIVVSNNINYSSLCPHHHMAIIGRCSIGYLPSNKIIGLSKLPRLVGFLSRRPIMQEKLGADIADRIMEILDPKAVCVKLKARHACVSARGVCQHEAEIITYAIRGKDALNVKDEILEHMRGD